MSVTRQFLLAILVLLGVTMFSDAFAPTPSMIRRTRFTASSTQRAAFIPSSSLEVSAVTLDPTTVLSDVMGGLLGSPAILLVPIVAAFGVAGVIAWFIVSYANPEVEDDE